MKRYKYDEWDLIPPTDETGWNFTDRTYIDLNGNKITGILEGFYGFGNLGTTHEQNCQCVINGKSTGRKK